MDLDGITRICDYLHLGYGPPRDGTEERGPQISISCPLAGKIIDGRKFHQEDYDSNNGCSIKIVDDGPSLVKCFSGFCGFRGTWLRLLQLALSNDSSQETTDFLESVASVEELTLEAKVIRNKKAIEKIAAQQAESLDSKDILPESRWDQFRHPIPEYAQKRGISPEMCIKFGLGFDPIGQRLVFPMRRRDNKLVGMQGRDITGKADRPHHIYEGFKKEKYLFGAQLLENGKPIVVCESAIGAVKTYQALYPEVCAVAPLGEGFSKFHADTITDANPPCLYIFTDGDAAGRAIASKIEYQMHGRLPMKVMESPTDIDENGKKIWDSGNLPEDQIKRLFRHARPVLDRIRWSTPLPTRQA